MSNHGKKINVRLWSVLGAPGVGKSTTIGSLISQRSRGGGGVRSVLLRGGGYMKVFARRMACQEAGLIPTEMVRLVDQQAHRVQNERPNIAASYFNVLLALRFDPANSCPAAHVYLSHFVNEGWKIESMVLLSPDNSRNHYERFGAPTLYLFESADLDEGWMVGQVRNHFGWA